MNIPSKYDPSKTEHKWYQYWMDHDLFKSEPDEREPYTIVIPPPNVTGVLHMGHMLNNTIQDILIRRARMSGYNALWVPGTDHASIATEAKVVGKLRSEGIKKSDLSREAFLEHAWEWRKKHGGIILEQLKKLGASCDWSRTKFTMDDDLSESVIKVFVDLFKKGKIYRGRRMVNWDPLAKTAVSDEEVTYKEEQSKLYHVKYKIAESDEFLTIATTRPETILGDTAVCVNPRDERYFHLKGKSAVIPLVNRVVPIIEDDYVDMEFGTGCLKITPAHDVNDYEIGLRHQLEVLDIFNDDATLNEDAVFFVGKDRFEARTLVINKLKDEGLLIKEEDYVNKVGYSERTDVVIEPRLSLQWFLKMKELAEPAIENVMNDNIRLHPEKFKNTYKHWMENIRDWCISRQLWWGHRIPAYYIEGTSDYVVAETMEEAVQLAREKTGNPSLAFEQLKQDEDVLDTWFSSWLWPITVFDGIRYPDNRDINYYYPTSDLVTAPEILFFWVARMIMAGYEYRNDKPFKNVYLTGIVRDAERRKMSKSLGNSPDPLELINKYGADGVRVGMMLCSPAGNDLLFDEGLTEQGRNFANKIWNVFRLIQSWNIDDSLPQPNESKNAVRWFDSLINQAIIQLKSQFNSFRISEALMLLYRMIWEDFASWYLEIIKPAYQKPMDAKTHALTIDFFEQLLTLLHPFMPFITEEIWQLLKERKEGESIMHAALPHAKPHEENLIPEFDHIKEIVRAIRTIRTENNIHAKKKLNLLVKGKELYEKQYGDLLKKLCFLEKISNTEEKVDKASSFIVDQSEFFVPLEELINVEQEKKKLEEEIKYAKGFLQSVQKKLNNERFVNNAPKEVVEKEHRKKQDAEEKIKKLEAQLDNLQ